MASLVIVVFLAPDLVHDRTVGLHMERFSSSIKAIRPMGWSVCLDVKLRSGMEISDLRLQFVQNYDRILSEIMKKDDQA